MVLRLENHPEVAVVSTLPGGGVVKNIVILLSEGLPNLLVLRVERHADSKVNFSENLLTPCNYLVIISLSKETRKMKNLITRTWSYKKQKLHLIYIKLKYGTTVL